MIVQQIRIILFLLHCSSVLSISCETCQSPPSDAIPLCRCDDQCRVYGDCCFDVSVYEDPPVISDNITAVLSYIECQSRYRSLLPLSVGDAYYMVSSCPHYSNWTQDKQYAKSIASNCTSLEFIDFPPVSDPSSGITYRNEFCAICHSVDTSALLTWSSRLVCGRALKDVSETQNITLDIIRQYCSRCSFDPPINSTAVMDTLRWCSPVKSSCPSRATIPGIYNETGYEEIAVDPCVNEEYDPIHKAVPLNWNLPYERIYFRNPDCVTCKYYAGFTLQCFYPNSSTSAQNNTARCIDMASDNFVIGAAPFSVLLDVTGSGVVSVTSSQIAEVEVIRCGENQVFDPVQVCRDIVCPNGFTPTAGMCVLEHTMSFNIPGLSPMRNATTNGTNITMPAENNTDINQTAGNITLNTTDIAGDMNTTSQLINGTSVAVNCTAIALDHDEYIITGDDNTSVIFRGEVLDIVGYDSIGRPLVCAGFSNTGNITVTRNSTLTHLFYPPGLAEISYVSVLLSIIANTLILITYSIFREFRTLPSKLLMNMAVAFLIGDIILLLSNVTSLYIDAIEFCVTLSVLLHCSFLARFSWMNCMGFEYVRTFYKALTLSGRLANPMSRNKRLVCYMLVGWGAPMVITIVTVVVNFAVEGSVRYGTDTYGEQGLCWINNKKAIIIAFATPVFLSTVLNLIAFVIVVSLLCCTTQNITIKELRKSQKMAHIRVALGVFLVLGLAWVFGFVALLSNQFWAWYPFIILNSNQAVFIAICFLFTRKVIHKYLSLFKIKPPNIMAGGEDSPNQVPMRVIQGACSLDSMVRSYSTTESSMMKIDSQRKI